MSITFYGDLRLGFSVIMSVHYSFKSDADLIRRISYPLCHTLFTTSWNIASIMKFNVGVNLKIINIMFNFALKLLSNSFKARLILISLLL